MIFLTLQAVSMHGMIEAFQLGLAGKLTIAVLCGGAIGLERQISGKPAGLRTNILICLGSALLMEISIKLGASVGGGRIGDPARLAAQVVTGIGFIGAGTIMQSRGAITGLTSAATLWVVAAIGLTAGAGFSVEALGATVMVMVVLAGLKPLERRLLRARRTQHATVRTRPGVELSWMKTVLFADGLSVISVELFEHEDDRVFEMRVSGPSRQFDIARASLLSRDQVLNVAFH